MSAAQDPADERRDVELLLEFIRQQRGFDFRGYKRTSLERRLHKRLEATKCPDFDAYTDFLELHPEEFERLFDTLLINVTRFRRDPESWNYIAETIIPAVLETKPAGEPIRVWTAGCATGEETYTVAMLLADALGVADYGERVKIYATDADEAALELARLATYEPRQMEDVPPEHLERYFLERDGRHQVRKELRRPVIFGRNDLVRDAPISRIDLLVCRNTLIYFNAETQSQVLRRLSFALAPTGFLFAGKSEMLITHNDHFVAHDLKRRVFTKAVATRPASSHGMPYAQRGGDEDHGPMLGLVGGAFDVGAVAQLIVDDEGRLVAANRRARLMFGLSRGHVGRAIEDVDGAFRPIGIRALVDRVFEDRRESVVDDLVVPTVDGDGRSVELRVLPLMADGSVVGATIVVEDHSHRRQMERELEEARRELDTSYEELQSTVEELETTNEEVQSTNEELETTNEELQSTNEELETMNEELHSTNEELETINDELRQRTAEVDEANRFLETILTSMRAGVVVLTPALRVRTWNAHSTELWGLRAEEAEGEPFLGLDIGLPVEQLKGPLRAAAERGEHAELTIDARNRRGQPFRCGVTIAPITDDDVAGLVVIMRDELAA